MSGRGGLLRRIKDLRPSSGAAWVVLGVSAVLEAVWATALGASEGFSRPVETVVFLGASTASLVGLSLAMTRIPAGTAYAAWTGTGAVLTVTWAAMTGTETLSPLKVVFLAGIIGCVIGLKAAGGAPAGDDFVPDGTR